MFIAIGGPQAHVTLSMTDTLFQQPARSRNATTRPPVNSTPLIVDYWVPGDSSAESPLDNFSVARDSGLIPLELASCRTTVEYLSGRRHVRINCAMPGLDRYA